jgi:hypothetical protein
VIIISAKGIDSIPGFVQDWMDRVGALRPEKIICAEFLEKVGSEIALTFHRFIEKWAAQNSEMLFSNLFPEGRTAAFPLPSIGIAAPVQNHNRIGVL